MDPERRARFEAEADVFRGLLMDPSEMTGDTGLADFARQYLEAAVESFTADMADIHLGNQQRAAQREAGLRDLFRSARGRDDGQRP